MAAPDGLNTVFKRLAGTVGSRVKIADLPEVRNVQTQKFKEAVAAPVIGAAEIAMSPVLSALTYSPNAEATLVPARSFLKGMKGVHPSFSLEDFTKFEKLAPNVSPKLLEKKFGIIRTPEGLKTNISDVGATLNKEGWERVQAGEEVDLDQILSHPAQATIQAAVRDPNLFRNVKVQPIKNPTAYGSYLPSEDVVGINPVTLLADSKDPVEVLLHEGGGHAIQARLGWQKGSSHARELKSAETSAAASKVNPREVLSSKMTSSQMSKLSPKEMEDWVTQIIAEDIYLRRAGEQGAEAPAQLYKLQKQGKLPEFAPVTDQMLYQIDQQLFSK